MKIVKLRFFVSTVLSALALGVLFAEGIYGAVIQGSNHDLTSKSWWRLPPDQLCSSCHVSSSSVDPATAATLPALGGGELWNHQLSAVIPTPYTSPFFNSKGIAITDPNTGSTRFCQSCHDGAVPLENFGGVTSGVNFITPANKISSDLKQTHPVGFQFNDALSKSPNLNWGLSTSTIYPGGGTTIGSRLSNGAMTCSTCHNGHDPQNTNFLVANNTGSALCTTCHSQARILGTKHDFSVNYWNVRKTVCGVCHTPHNSSQDQLGNHQLSPGIPTPYTSPTFDTKGIAITDPSQGDTRACMGCHDGAVPLENFGGVTSGSNFITPANKISSNLKGSHPVGFQFSDALSKSPNLNWGLSTSTIYPGGATTIGSRLANGAMTCSTCHDGHNPQNTNFLVANNTGSGLCTTCHIQSVIVGSKHDLSVNYWNNTRTVCGVCHSPHNASQDQLGNHQPSAVAPTPYSSPSFNTRGIAIADPYQGDTRACMGCHDGAVALENSGSVTTGTNFITLANKISSNLKGSHPVGFQFSDALSKSPNLQPGLSTSNFFPGGGTIASRLPGGTMTCSTCHEVHDNRKGYFLVAYNNGSALCATCHRQANYAATASAGMAGSKHDLSNNAWNSMHTLCGVCHTTHNSTQDQLGNHQLSTAARTPYSSPSFNATGITISDPYNGDTRVCMSCHDGSVALENFGGVTTGSNFIPANKSLLSTSMQHTHPVGFLFSDALAKSSKLKAGLSVNSTYLGNPNNVTIASRLSNGYMTCSTCHDVHNSQSVPATGNAQGPARFLLLSGKTNTALCLTCHDQVYAAVAHPSGAFVTNSPVVYNGLPQAAVVAAASDYAGSLSNVNYNGSATVPTNAGFYTVTVDSGNAGEFLIDKATPTLTVTNNDGLSPTAGVGASAPGTVRNIKYNGSAVVPTAVGVYAITADFTPTDTANYYSLANAAAGSFAITHSATTGAATIISATGATLNGTVNADASNASISFDYGLTATYGSNVAAIPAAVSSSVDTSVSAMLSGLNPATVYHFRVKMVYSGVSLTGSDQTFTTGPIMRSVTPAAGPGGNITPSITQSVPNGTTTSFTIKPTSGFKVALPVGGNCGGSFTGSFFDPVNGLTFTTSPVTADCSVVASFAPDVMVASILVDPLTPTTLCAGLDGAGIFRSVNGGATWTAATGQPTSKWVKQLVFDPRVHTTLYGATYGGGIFTSTDSGDHWAANAGQPTNLNALTLAIDPAGIFYAGTEGGIFKSLNGTSWILKGTGLSASAATPPLAITIDPVAPATLYTGLNGAGVYKSSNSGDAWTAATSQPADLHVKALVIKPGDSSTLYAATYGGGVYISNNSSGDSGNNGLVWAVCTDGITANSGLSNLNVVSLTIDASGKLYAGTEGGVFVSSDGCATWAPMNSGLPN